MEQSGLTMVEFISSPVVAVIITASLTLVGVFLGAKLQGRHAKEIEKDRLRHEVATLAAKERLRVHIDLAAKVADAYRAKFTMDSEAKTILDDAKNFYYDNIFFYSYALGDAFRKVAASLAIQASKRDIAEANKNAFFVVIREDLLLNELSESVGRAITVAPSAD